MAKVAAKVASANTFRAVAEEYVDKLKRERQAERTLQKTGWLLSLAYPNLGTRPIAEITAPEVLAVLQAVERRGRHESARRLRSTISRVFRYAVATARADTDPTFALRGALTAPVVTSRAAVTDPTALEKMIGAQRALLRSPRIIALAAATAAGLHRRLRNSLTHCSDLHI